MRKVLVCGAAFAATCLSALAVPAGAGAAMPLGAAIPLREPAPPSAPTIVPTEETGTGAPSGSPETGETAPPGESPTREAPTLESPDAPPQGGTSGGPGTTDGVVSGQAVMVTPALPKSKTYAYGKASRQRIDAYWRPAPKAAPRPAVLMIHGGYWLGGDKRSWKYFARRLTADGYVVLAPNYRLAPKAVWPAQRDDAMSALGFMKKHAKLWNLDPNRIIVIGSSSGGMLATQLGTYGTGTQQVRGVVALSPPNNPFLAFTDGAKPGAPAAERTLRRAVIALVHCTPGETADAACWKRVDDASSASHVSPGDAPMLLMHSTGDFVPATHSTGLATALRAAGVEATVKVLPGEMHASGLLEDEHTYPQILAWLRNHSG
ncbi:alpha/beta hydrolase [Actinomadura terrae]|uniref:alpha/beta hydrolase n=1 Tax=Actinomadura terrae TaxID=604353 RepID=UPI001FA6F2CC|nr:alpha/beta hydrolase [Actinomadura terrae]